jgi:hypothetical protein
MGWVGIFMGLKKLSLMILAISLMSACSQNRLGMGGRYDTAYLLQPVELCRNISGQKRGCFSIQVSLNDNLAYLDIAGIDSNIANQWLRVGARTNASSNEELQIISGDEVRNNRFIAIPDSYIVVAPSGGRSITEYTEWFVEIPTTANPGVGLTPVAASIGNGTKIAHDFIAYYDLDAVLAELGWNYY